jgi:hypothetical protein
MLLDSVVVVNSINHEMQKFLGKDLLMIENAEGRLVIREGIGGPAIAVFNQGAWAYWFMTGRKA